MNFGLEGMLAVVILGGGGVLLLVWLLPARPCPRCRAPLPKFRTPENLQQILTGGWRCPSCGAAVDGRGQLR